MTASIELVAEKVVASLLETLPQQVARGATVKTAAFLIGVEDHECTMRSVIAEDEYVENFLAMILEAAKEFPVGALIYTATALSLDWETARQVEFDQDRMLESEAKVVSVLVGYESPNVRCAWIALKDEDGTLLDWCEMDADGTYGLVPSLFNKPN